MASDRKKREWFDLGAAAFARDCPGIFDQPTYPCPICLSPFTTEALADKRLSAEHVPPKSVGGRELLLTCRVCNNSSGTKLDADAKTKEDVQIAVSGMTGRPHRIKAMIGGVRVNGELHTSEGKYSLRILPKINKPGTNEALRDVVRAGTQLTVEHESFSELGAKISWLRSGYLALFAVAGYKSALDPAMQIVRQQILECDERKMITFTSEAQQDIPLTERRILRVLAPQWHLGWAVQFGRYFVQFPSPGDMSFYDRLAASGLEPVVQNTTYENMGWPDKPTFGQPLIIHDAV
jgi:HNH endonuclease